MLDLQLYKANIAQNVLVTLDALADSQRKVLTRANPTLMGAMILEGADVQYMKVDATGLPSVGLIIPSKLNPLFPRPGDRLIQQDKLNVQCFQDSGGVEDVTVGLWLAYQQAKAKRSGRSVGVIVDITDGTALWGTGVAIEGLDASKMYQILSYYNICADGIAIRFTNPDFDGLHPGGPALGTDTKQDQQIVFPENDVPTFSGANDLLVSGLGAGSANKVFIDMIEL